MHQKQPPAKVAFSSFPDAGSLVSVFGPLPVMTVVAAMSTSDRMINDNVNFDIVLLLPRDIRYSTRSAAGRPLLFRLIRLGKSKGRRIDAVAKPGRFRAILEHVAQMRIASRAQHLRPL